MSAVAQLAVVRNIKTPAAKHPKKKLVISGATPVDLCDVDQVVDGIVDYFA